MADKKFRFDKRRLWRAAAVIPIVIAAKLISLYVTPNYGLMLVRKIAGCLPWDVYWWKKQQAVLPLARYDVILFPSRGMEPVIEEGQPIGKMVAGLPGDRVRIEAGNVFINDTFIGDVRYGAKKLGKPVSYWDKVYTLGKDEIFVYGSEEHSWDSRYWGSYPLHLVRGRIAAVF